MGAWTSWSPCSHSCGGQGIISRSRNITKLSSRRVHEQRQTAPCNRHRCPFPLSSFNLSEWSKWLPDCFGLQVPQNIWRQRRPQIPEDAYHADGNIEIVRVFLQKNMRSRRKTVTGNLFSIFLANPFSFKRDPAPSVVIPVSGSAVQNAAAMVRQRSFTAEGWSTSQKYEAQERMCHPVKTSLNTCVVLFQWTVHGRKRPRSRVWRSKTFRLLIANGLWIAVTPQEFGTYSCQSVVSDPSKRTEWIKMHTLWMSSSKGIEKAVSLLWWRVDISKLRTHKVLQKSVSSQENPRRSNRYV